MNEKQQQLLFDKGITNVPSDALCSDNTLAESIGMVYADGEHKVIQKPVKQMEYNVGYTNYKILYIHKYNERKRYITWKSEGHYSTTYSLVWCENVNGVLTSRGTFSGVSVSSDSTALVVSSIGKTLIVSDANGMHYFLWNVDDNSYKNIGDIPSPDVEFFLTDVKSRMGGNRSNPQQTTVNVKITSKASFRGIVTHETGTIRRWIIDSDRSTQADYNNLVVGLYAKNKKELNQKKCFCEPFFIRTAIELYDGSYHMISQPILMFPSITTNTYGSLDDIDKTISLTTYGCELHYVNKSHFEDWSDIVKDVVVFITDDISIYDLSVDQAMWQEVSQGHLFYNGLYRAVNGTKTTYHTATTPATGHPDYEFNCMVLDQRPQDEIEKDIVSRSVFYKLCSIGRSYDGAERDIAEKIETHTLENITTQERLDADDYYSRSVLNPSFIYSYNSRLNIASVLRSMFEGYGCFMPYDNDTAATYKFYVSIKTDSGTRLVRHIETDIYQKQGIWFYYPDSRAYHVMIFKGNDCILDADLTEHSGLNGAYYFKGLPESSEPETPVNAVEPTYTEPDPEMLSNYIIQSEVNNPFVFKAEGYYKVGTGKIMAMSSTTQALSEGQFGQFPLLVFSESGIWALTVASTGYYDSIHPISREVLSNKRSVTQTDGAVFFVSKKGLMIVVGNQVKCVSEQLSGKSKTNDILRDEISFNEFLQNAFIAYDYRDSLLWIFNTNIITTAQQPYIYSIKSGTFGRVTSDLYDSWTITNTVNDYPDYLLSAGNYFYSLLDRPDINADGTIVDNVFVQNTYSAKMVSRPLKLENALALKSIMQVKHIHDLNENATLTLRIFASNDLKHWFEMSSIRGVPWKYYKFRYDFTNLKATDRFAGTMLITQERRTNKLR